MTASLLTRPDVGAAMVGGIAPPLPFPRRILKHPRLVHYNRLVALAMTVNLGWAVYGATVANWWTPDGTDLAQWRGRVLEDLPEFEFVTLSRPRSSRTRSMCTRPVRKPKSPVGVPMP